jgi:hypothetical protein
MGHLARWVHLISLFPTAPNTLFNPLGSCPGGESVEDMQCRVDTIIAKVRGRNFLSYTRDDPAIW